MCARYVAFWVCDARTCAMATFWPVVLHDLFPSHTCHTNGIILWCTCDPFDLLTSMLQRLETVTSLPSAVYHACLEYDWPCHTVILCSHMFCQSEVHLETRAFFLPSRCAMMRSSSGSFSSADIRALADTHAKCIYRLVGFFVSALDCRP